MKKEKLKNYNIICTNEDELRECVFFLQTLGFCTLDSNVDKECCLFICFENKFENEYFRIEHDSYQLPYLQENLSYAQFKQIMKEFEKKLDLISKTNGTVVKISNYNSKKIVYYVDFKTNDFIQKIVICKAEKELLDNLIQLGFLFKTRRDCINFIEFLKKRKYDF